MGYIIHYFSNTEERILLCTDGAPEAGRELGAPWGALFHLFFEVLHWTRPREHTQQFSTAGMNKGMEFGAKVSDQRPPFGAILWTILPESYANHSPLSFSYLPWLFPMLPGGPKMAAESLISATEHALLICFNLCARAGGEGVGGFNALMSLTTRKQ